MATERNFWYHVGYALERAKGGPVESALPTRTDGEAAGDDEDGPSEDRALEGTDGTASLHPLAEQALAAASVAGGGAVVATALRIWRPRHEVGLWDLVRAGTAGAGAAMARMVVRRFMSSHGPEPDGTDPMAPILAGAARGIVYAQVVEPRLPGPVVLRGASYGALEFVAAPWGGLEAVLDTLPAHRRVPFLAELFGARDEDPSLGGHVLFGVILASLYGDPR